MTDDQNKPGGFKIFDDDAPSGEDEETPLLPSEDMIASEPKASLAAKSGDQKGGSGFRGMRLFFALLLVFCIFAGSIYGVYYHLHNRLNDIETAGSHEMADLSREIDDRMGLFSTQFARQHAEMQVQIENLAQLADKNIEAIENIEKTVDANRQTLSGDIAELENRMDDLSGRIDALDAKTTDTIREMEIRMEELADSVANSSKIAAAARERMQAVDNLASRIDDLSTRLEQLSDTITPEIREQTERFQQEFTQRVDALRDRMDSETDSLEDEIEALDAMIRSMRQVLLEQDGQTEIIEQELQ